MNSATRVWTPLASGDGVSAPFWSRDGKSVYYQETLAPEQPIFRAAVGGAKKERIMSSKQIPQSNSPSAFCWLGWDPTMRLSPP